MRNIIFILAAVTALVFTSCKHEAESVSISPESITITVGSTYQLQAAVKPGSASQRVEWSSSCATVATVSSTGLVTAVGEGQCEIKAVANHLEALCMVTVTGAEGSKTIMVNGVAIKMIKVQGGTFTMGATPEQSGDSYSDEAPAHQVTLSDYYLAETEVTQALWKAVMESNPSRFVADDHLPVESVTWADCITFITKLNQLTGSSFRLPTEAEWEYAARGGNKSKGYKYAGSNTIGEVAWYKDNAGQTTHAVAGKQANELGLYDMSGNVWEWCANWYEDYTSQAQTNPQGPNAGTERMLRGGCWRVDARDSRVSLRSYSEPDYSNYDIGFRLAL